MLTAEITIRFVIENSGFKVPIITVHNAPSQTYAITNIPETMSLKPEVNDAILLAAA
jgi:hypothetical protein